MNKSTLVKAIQDKSQYNVSQAMAEDMVNTFIKVVTESVANGDPVQLVGFGTFTTSTRAARQGRNPQTGAMMTIPAKKVPKFSAGKAFKDAVK